MAGPDVHRLTLEDLMDNPKKYGLPTLAEFARNPAILRGAADELFANVDKGSAILGKQVREHRYYWRGIKMDSLERVQKAAMDDMGLGVDALTVKPELERGTAGKYIIHVYVEPKRKLVSV